MVLRYKPINDPSGANESFDMLLYYDDILNSGITKAFKLPEPVRSIATTKFYKYDASTYFFAYLGPKDDKIKTNLFRLSPTPVFSLSKASTPYGSPP